MAAATRNYGDDEDILRGDPWVDYVVLEVAADDLGHDPDPEVDEDWQPFDPSDLEWSMVLRRRRGGTDDDPDVEVTVAVVTVADVDDPPAELVALPVDTPILKLSLTGDETKELAGSYYHDLQSDDEQTWQRGQFWLTEQVTV